MKLDRTKTLVLLIPGFPADESDSTCLPAQQSFVLTLQRKFPALEIQIVTFQYPFKSVSYQWHGTRVMPLNGGNKGGVMRIVIWMKAWNYLKKLRKQSQIIGLLSFWCTECALVGKWFARKNDLKHLCWILGQDARKSNRFVKLIRPIPNELIALSQFLQDEFERNHHIQPAHVIRNAIEPNKFPPLNSERHIDLIGVGSLIALKQYDIFISIVKKLVEQFPSLKAMICGKGPEEDSLQRIINESGLNNNIMLLGEKPHSEVLQLLQESKILLHPSSYEGYSTVCLEALFAGAHVVSFAKPDQQKVNQWHPVSTIEQMEHKVRALLLEPNLVHKRVLLSAAEESVEAVMKLFDMEVTAL